MLKPTCLAFDLDHTITRFVLPYRTIFTLFADQGVPIALVERAYERIRRDSVFTISHLVDAVVDETDVFLDVPKIHQGFETWLKNSVRLFPDAEPLIGPLPLPVAIITLGDPLYQKKKVDLSGIRFNDFLPVTEPEAKAPAMRTLLKKYGAPIAFVDDRVGELDALRDAGLTEEDVQTFRLMRPKGKHNEEAARFSHTAITSLDPFFTRMRI